MKRAIDKKFAAFLLGFSYVIAGCMPVLADDTEIYFGNPGNNSGTANLLFILDTSGSMSTDDDNNGTSRMDDLKTAFKNLMGKIQNVNVGMMRFSDPGGPVLYPVTNVDKQVYDSTFGSISSTIATGNDDGYQFNSSGTVVLNTNGLEIGAQAPSGVTITSTNTSVSTSSNDAVTNLSTATTTTNGRTLLFPTNQNDGSQQRVDGIRFSGVQIPKGATIVRAYIQLETVSVGQNDNGPLQISFIGEKADQGAFDTSTHSPSARFASTSNLVPVASGTLSPVIWSVSNASMPAVDDLVRTTDVKTILQAMVNDSSWGSTSGNASFLMYKTAGSTSLNWLGFSSYDRGTSNPPKLVVDYYTGSATLKDVTTAVRFTNVNVPKGATITSATITFTAENTDSSAIDVTIKGEKAGNSAALSTTTNNITSRTKTAASVTWSGVPSWSAGQTYNTPDLSSLVTEITSSSTTWCGGNAMTFLLTGAAGRRFAEAYEDGSLTAPTLTIKYDPATIPDGSSCQNATQTFQVLNSSDDAEQYSNTSVISDPSLELVAFKKGSTSYAQKVGFRFNNIKIPKGSTITSAYLQLTANNTDSNTIALTINGEATDNSSTFTTTSNNISNRALTSAYVGWSPTAWTNGSVYNSPDITSVVQELINRANWASGNSMTMLITSSDSNASSTSYRRVAAAYDAGSSKAAKLIINYQDKTAPAAQTVRNVLSSTADTLNPAGYTPIQDTMYEAAKYMRGEAVFYGTYRGGGPYSYTRVSHPNSYTGGAVYRPSGCTDANLSASACANEVINGSPVYISPITSSCQVNHVVLLTDGLANHNHSDSLVQSMIGQSSCADSGTGMACVQDLAAWMYNNDMSSSVAGKQNIITDTIAFNLTDATATNFLNRVAIAGGGKSYSATNADSLATVFDNIVGQVSAQNTTFVSAGTAVNAFNRTVNRDDLYFAVFRPDIKPKWPGNLKKYKLSSATNTLAVLDKNGVNAVDANGFFADGSQSYWSATPDGADVTKGGAAALITDYTARKVYTYLDDIASPSKTLTAAANNVDSTNINLTQAEMGVSGYTAAQLTNLIDWTRGRDVLDENGDGSTSDTRYVFADPLHSRPVAITYGGTDTNPDITIFVTTNSGFLHAINNTSGAEVFSFIPKDLLPIQQTLYANSSTDAHPSGLDGALTYWITDPDNDGVVLNSSNQIEAGNSIKIAFGMRRGGRNYYALDVTDRANPKVLWVIKGGMTAGFNSLGQTWAQPLKTKINIGGAVRDVLVFSGGYDPNQDTSTSRSSSATDSMGNAIYIVDSDTGALLWSGSNQAGSTVVFSDMKYSIPATVNIADIDGDGLTDLIFVGDTGGQVWRFDVHNGSAASGLVTGGVIADLNAASDAPTPANDRRFYHTPALVYGLSGSTPYLGVLIGSGWRAHPLDTATDDQFFMIKQTNIFSAPSSYTKLTETDLFDASNNVIGEGTAAQKTAAVTQLQGASGWYITLPNDGEKVLSTPLVLEGQVYFDTYQPGTAPSSDPCAPSTGINRAYVVNANDATPVYNYNGGALQAGDRSYILNTPGIVDQPRAIYQKGRLVIMQGPVASQGPTNFLQGIHRNYWSEKR